MSDLFSPIIISTPEHRVPLSGRNLGCSKGFDTKDYGYVTNGGTEDGYAAIKAATDFAAGLSQIDNSPLDACLSTNYYMILVSCLICLFVCL